MDLTTLHELSASDAARLIREGVINSQQLIEACLARIREIDAEVQAWAFLDPDHALAQARAADAWRSEGRPTGPLHGVPVGIKDIFNTVDMPTEYGSPLYEGHTPSRDATAVAMLRAAGAVIMASVSSEPTKPALVVKRVAAASFPYDYKLTADDITLVGSSFSGKMYVTARVDAAGMIGPPRAGTFEGTYSGNPVPVGSTKVDIVINKAY
jgi:amidase